jgi:hypothetical protein
VALFSAQQDERAWGRVLADIPGGSQWEWIPVRWDRAIQVIMQLEKSRVHLGLPRKRADVDIGLDDDDPAA